MTTTAIILARGLGTRLRTDDGTALDGAAAVVAASGIKALMPVAGRPLLVHQAERLRAAGIRRLVLVVAPEHDALRAAVADLVGLEVAWAVQERPLGTADAVAAAAPRLDGPALVLNGDTLYPAAAVRACAGAAGAAVVGFTRASLRAGGIPDGRIARFAVLVAGVGGWLSRIIEKPSAAQLDGLGAEPLAGMNLWRLTPELVAGCATVPISPRGERELPLAVQRAVDGGARVEVLRCDEPIHDLTFRADVAVVERRLGGSAAEDGRTALIARAGSRLAGAAEAGWWVPGRIELLGKHTDYAGGPSLVCAADRGFAVLARRGGDGVRISGDRGSAVCAPEGPAGEGWERYVRAVVRRLSRDFPGACAPVAIALASDLPAAAGLSSSSALVVAVAEALRWAWRLDARPEGAFLADPLERATYWSCLENGRAYIGPGAGPSAVFAADGGVGTAGGSEDHVAIIAGTGGRCSCFAYAPVQALGTAPLPAGWGLLVADSGVVAEKTGSAGARYNACSALQAAAVATWNRRSGRSDPHLAAACASAGEGAVLAALDGAELRRARHFCTESGLVRQGFAALERQDAATFAAVVRASQEAAGSLLGNQVPETEALCRDAVEAGATCATSFGAGFGGAVWALAPDAEASAIAQRWERAAATRTGRPLARIQQMHPGTPCHPLELP